MEEGHDRYTIQRICSISSICAREVYTCRETHLEVKRTPGISSLAAINLMYTSPGNRSITDGGNEIELCPPEKQS
jgi:hypothetical protein